jgi:hypothetical protein
MSRIRVGSVAVLVVAFRPPSLLEEFCRGRPATSGNRTQANIQLLSDRARSGILPLGRCQRRCRPVPSRGDDTMGR